MTATAPARRELAHDVMRETRRRSLDAMLTPRNVAVIGASEKVGSVGQALVQNLQVFEGRVFPVNPKHTSVGGLEALPNIAEMKRVARKVGFKVEHIPGENEYRAELAL